MGTPSQECDDELVRLGVSSFQSGNFVCFYFYFLQDMAAEMLFNKYFTIVFIDAPMCKQCQQCEKKKQCKIRRKIAPTISDDLFFSSKTWQQRCC